MYTDDRNAQVVLSLLKQYGIRKIVVSPGTTNVPISRTVQVDPWFEVYSVVDERSAAYFAGGLAYESGEPVVISCTGATASRNYVPGLTEAYYRQLPVIALTSQHHVSDFGNLVPQVTDRTTLQNDIKKVSVHLPVVKDDEDYERCVISTNRALIAATTGGGGPVHINLHVNNFSFTTQELPVVRKIEYYNTERVQRESKDILTQLTNKKVAIFIGSHHKFDKELQKKIEVFSEKMDAPIIVDQTSSYKGKNSVLLSQIAAVKRSKNKPDLVIDIGSITGEYSVSWMSGIETWRVSEDGQIHDRLHNQVKLFDCSEGVFFGIATDFRGRNKLGYADELKREAKNVETPDLPFSNTYISYELSKNIPNNSNLHLAILNSLRNMNFYKLHETIDSSSNVGGFGIDGALSTMIGQSMVNSKKLTFGLVGDLAAFYDMNALGIRHIKNNLRIILVNNGGGVEFRLNPTMEDQWAEETNDFISAYGHNGSMKAWAESMNFHYMSAKTKQEYRDQIRDFCSSNVDHFSKPVLFEVFTEIPEEQSGLRTMRTSGEMPKDESAIPQEVAASSAIKSKMKKVAPQTVKRVYRKIRNG